MDEYSNVCTEPPSDNLPSGECEQANQSEMDLQFSSISDKSGSDISPTTNIENDLHLESLVDLEQIVQTENNSQTVLEITEIIDDTESNNIKSLTDDHPIILTDNIPKDELKYSLDSPSINDDDIEFNFDNSKPSSNSDASLLTDEIHNNHPISDNTITSESLPSLKIIPNRSIEESNDRNHSNEFNSTSHTHDCQDDEPCSPYELYARHIFNIPAPVRPPRHKKKLHLAQHPSMDGEEPDMDVAPRSKKLCRYEDLEPSDIELGDPSLDTSTSMDDTAILVEDIPTMDTTLSIDTSLTMETANNSLSSSPSYESISDVESIEEIPICFSSTQRPLRLNFKNISINE